MLLMDYLWPHMDARAFPDFSQKQETRWYKRCHCAKSLAANYANYANGRASNVLCAPIRVIGVIRG
jgi:hypothetical protein